MNYASIDQTLKKFPYLEVIYFSMLRSAMKWAVDGSLRWVISFGVSFHSGSLCLFSYVWQGNCHVALLYPSSIKNECLFLTQSIFKPLSSAVQLTPLFSQHLRKQRSLSVVSGLYLRIFLTKHLFLPLVAPSLYSNLSSSKPDHFLIWLLMERILVLQRTVLNPAVAQVTGFPILCQRCVAALLYPQP